MPKTTLNNVDTKTLWRIDMGAAYAGERRREYMIKAAIQRLARQPIPRSVLELPSFPPFDEWLREASDPVLTLPDGTQLNEEQLLAFARATVLRTPELWHEWVGAEKGESSET